MTTTNPTLLAVPIAKDGNKNTIPATQATAGNGLMSQSTGFPPETSLPLGAGGVAPTREDFNGAFNLLGGVAFYAQKGWTFNYDATQDYYKGCIIIDPTDGKRYECIADMTAGTIAPHDDTTNIYWKEFGVDTSVLANTDLSNLTQDGEDHFLKQDFTIIYPNGGTEANPANISANSRYVEVNPFAGYYVRCQLEVYLNSEWGILGYYTDANGSSIYNGGASCSQFDDGSIVIQTLNSGLMIRSYEDGNPFGISSGLYTSLPCRVKVWKIGKAASA